MNSKMCLHPIFGTITKNDWSRHWGTRLCYDESNNVWSVLVITVISLCIIKKLIKPVYLRCSCGKGSWNTKLAEFKKDQKYFAK